MSIDSWMPTYSLDLLMHTATHHTLRNVVKFETDHYSSVFQKHVM